MMMIKAPLLLSVLASVSAADANLRARLLTSPDDECATSAVCSLVNLETEEAIPLGGSTASYNPSDSSKGFAIGCDTGAGKIEYVKYFLDGAEFTDQYYSPERYDDASEQTYWMNGDNRGDRVNSVKPFMECGTKSIDITFHTWQGGNTYPCIEKSFKVAPSGCECPAPKKFTNAGALGPLNKCITRTGKTSSSKTTSPITGNLEGIPESSFQTHRAGVDFTYQFDHENYVNGHNYLITIGFAETVEDLCGAGRRVMDITVNGESYESSLDVWSASGGACNQALVIQREFMADESGFAVQFTGTTNEAMFSTMTVEPVKSHRRRLSEKFC